MIFHNHILSVMSDMQLDSEEVGEKTMTMTKPLGLSVPQNQESGSIMELTEVEYNATGDIVAEVGQEAKEEVYEAEDTEDSNRKEENSTPHLSSSTRHHQSGTMMELTTAAEQSQNHTRNVLASLGGFARDEPSQEVNLSLASANMSVNMSTNMTITESFANAAPTPVVIEPNASVRSEALSSAMDTSARFSTTPSRAPSKDNVCLYLYFDGME